MYPIQVTSNNKDNIRRPCIREIKLTDKRYEKRKEEEDSPALKIVWKHQYEDSTTTLKRAKKV